MLFGAGHFSGRQLRRMLSSYSVIILAPALGATEIAITYITISPADGPQDHLPTMFEAAGSPTRMWRYF